MTGGHDDIVTLDKLTPISLHVPSEKQISRSKACLCVWWPAVWFCQYCIFTICKLLKQWRHCCPAIYRILLGGTLQCKVLVNETAWRISSFSFVCQNSSKRIISLRGTRIVQYPWNKISFLYNTEDDFQNDVLMLTRITFSIFRINVLGLIWCD